MRMKSCLGIDKICSASTKRQVACAAIFIFGLDSLFAAELPNNQPAARLPLSEVILYSSGVGYFERRGEVDGRADIELKFKVDDINDLLKSMVVQDFSGGQVSTV